MKLATVELSVGESPTLDYCNLNPYNINNKIFKRFIEDLNKDRKKDMTFFLNNLETVKIKKVSKLKGVVSGAGAQYSMDKNIIEIIDHDRFDDFIDHELLHMSSSILDENGNIYSGFIQARGEYGIGYGLDEGYTSLLDDRYFLHRTKVKEVENLQIYQVVKTLAKRVEEFIGQEKMEDLYFSANLLDLIQILGKYTSVSSAMQFVHNIDEILMLYEQAAFRNIPFCFKKYAECMLFICEAWLYRIDEGYINGQLNKEEYIQCLDMIKQLLNARLSLNVLPIKSYKIDKFYPQMKNRVAKRLEKKYSNKRKDTTITN